MYTEKYKKTTSDSSANRMKKPLQNAQIKNSAKNFYDVKMQYKPTRFPPIQTSFSVQHTNKPYVIQRVLKQVDPSNEEVFTTDKLSDIMEEVYYAELEDIADRNAVELKIKELIESAEVFSFRYFYELKDYLYGYFSVQSSKKSSEESLEESLEETPYVFTRPRPLSQYPNYHRNIKKKIVSTITSRALRHLLRKSGQTNFDFYIKNEKEIWVSDNHSKKAEKDTGYDIIFHTETDFEVIKRDSSAESDE